MRIDYDQQSFFKKLIKLSIHRAHVKSEIDAQKENLATAAKNLETAMNTGNDKIKEIIQRENEKRQKDMMVIIENINENWIITITL